MIQIQGYSNITVEISADGNEIRFYMSDGTKKYLYDVSRNECFVVEDYVTSRDDCFQIKDVSTEKSLSDYGKTYQMEDGRYISYVLDGELESYAFFWLSFVWWWGL